MTDFPGDRTPAAYDHLAETARRYAERAERAKQQTAALTKLVADGSFARFSDQIDRATRAQERITAAARNAATARALATGELQRHAAVMATHSRLSDVLAAKARNEAIARDVQSGAIGRQAAVMAGLNREYQSLQKQAQVQELVARHGTAGAVRRAAAPEIATLQSAGSAAYGRAAGFVTGAVRSGLQGTVEEYRLNYSFQLLNRQIAAVAVPAIDKMAHVVGRVATVFERMPGPMQDTLLAFGLVGLAAGPLVGAVRAVGAVGGAFGGLARTAGLAGAAAPAVGASIFAQGTAAAVGTAAGGAAARGGLGRFAPFALAGTALAAGAAGDRADELNYYRLYRNAGGSKVGSAVRSTLSSTAELFGLNQITGEDRRAELQGRRQRDLFGAERHRDVSPLQVGVDELGGAAQRIQEAVLKVTAAKEEERAEAMRENTEALKALNEQVRQQREEDLRHGGFFRGGKQ